MHEGWTDPVGVTDVILGASPVHMVDSAHGAIHEHGGTNGIRERR